MVSEGQRQKQQPRSLYRGGADAGPVAWITANGGEMSDWQQVFSSICLEENKSFVKNTLDKYGF